MDDNAELLKRLKSPISATNTYRATFKGYKNPSASNNIISYRVKKSILFRKKVRFCAGVFIRKSAFCVIWIKRKERCFRNAVMPKTGSPTEFHLFEKA